MSRMNAFVMVVLLALTWSTRAADLQTISKTLAPATEEIAVDKPEPTALQANWWKYFEVEVEPLHQRIDETIQRLNILYANELPKEQLGAAQPLVERIKANLSALPDLKALPTPEPPPPPAFANSYSLDQLLAIASRLRNVNADILLEQDDIESAEKAVKNASQRVDTLLAAYLTLAPGAPERVVRGLEIMAERSAVAVAEQQLRVRKAAFENAKALARQLEEERSLGVERLAADQSDISRLDERIAQIREQLVQARERLIKEQARALDVVAVADPVEAEATTRYRQQRAIAAGVRDANVTLNLLLLQAEQLLISLLLNDVENEPLALREQLADWRGQLVSISDQADNWSNASERERQRASEAVVTDSQRLDTDPPMFYELINDDRLKLVRETVADLQQLNDQIQQLDLLIQLAERQIARLEGGLQAWWNQTAQILNQGWENAGELMSRSLFKLGDTPVTALGFLRVGVILVFAWLISYWLRYVLKRLSDRREGANESAYYTVGRLSHYIIMTIGLFAGLASIGIGFSNFALLAGAAAFGIGFGLQSIVNNFVSGLIILFDRSLKVGDFVELASGVAGEVRAIKVRSTVINTNDNIDIVVPNSEFINTKVINWTLQEDYRRIHIPFGVAYDSDKDLVREAVLEAANELPHTLTGIPGRNPGVWLVGYGESRMDFSLVVWVTPKAVKRPQAVHAAYMWEIDTALRKHGIKVPFPQRDLHLKTGFENVVQSLPAQRSKNF